MRAYDLLLRLFPRSFRNEYGSEMRAIVARRFRDARSGPARAALSLQVAVQVLRDAALVHADLLRHDVSYSLRRLARDRGFAFSVVVVCAVGIGATTAVFSVADHVLLRPLPFRDPDRLVKLWQDQSFRGYSRMETSPSNYRDWVAMSRSFSSIGAFWSSSMNLTGSGRPERLDGTLVTPDFFAVLGVPARIGRTLLRTDTSGPAPVVISHELWQSHFGGDASLVGRTILLDQTPHTVVGVMPPRFEFPVRGNSFWVPLVFDPDAYADRNNTYLRVVARLAPGVSIDAARSELRGIARRLERAYPRELARTSVTIVTLRDEISNQPRLMLGALVGASACLLLVACVNLAHLLLARAMHRRRELAVRAAIGASPERLVRQLVTENLLLTSAGGVLGLMLAVAAVPVIARLVPTTLPISEVPATDLRLVALGAVLTLMTGIGFGVAPAIRLSRAASFEGLREGARTGTSRDAERLRSALVITEVAVSLVLLVVTGLLVRALWRVQEVDPGFRSEHVLTLRTALPMPAYRTTARREALLGRVLADIRAWPGVKGAAYTSFLPMVMRGGIWSVTPEGEPDDPVDARSVSLRLVTPGFFDALSIQRRAGRDFDGRDSVANVPLDGTSPLPVPAIVSDSFVRQYLPPGVPLGRRFTMAFMQATIVGVVGDIRVRGLERDSEPQVYVASSAIPDGAVPFYIPKDLVVSTSGSVEDLVPAVSRIIARADPDLPISDVRPLSAIVEAETASRRTQLGVLIGFAAVALLLASVGINGLLAYVVSTRAREFGVRLALGARRADILRLVLERGLVLAAIGIALGVFLGMTAGQVVQALLAGVSPRDPGTFAAAGLVAFVMVTIGALVPALRATRVDPTVTMRVE
jgi:predicted permease